MEAYRDILKSANYIAGEWLAEGKGVHPVYDKYSGELLAQLPLADASQVERAIQFAVEGKETLAKWSAGKRAEYLQRIANLLEAKRTEFVDLIVREGGKPIDYARNEVERGLGTLRLAAGEATRFGGEYVPMDFGIGQGKTAIAKRFPLGVVVGITPFNFPLNLVLHKVAPALATGSPMILKPAPQAPLTALALAALLQEAGFPAVALQVLVCENALAERLVTDARIAMLSFTGSDKVGWHLKSIAGKKRTALELGGNAAVVVDETADLEKAAAMVCAGAYNYAGQVCIKTQRIYVVDAIFETFKNKLLQQVEKVKTGNPHEEGLLNGPIIDVHHLRRIESWVAEALAAGATLLTGGKILDETHHLYAPTLLTATRAGMKVVDEEIFGPVAILESIANFEEGLARVNEGKYGLQAGVFTQRVDRMKLAHEKLEVGGVIVGGVPGFRVDSMPYGGTKDSGTGREGVRYAMEEMTEPRLLVF